MKIEKKYIAVAFAAVLFFIIISGCIQTKSRSSNIPNEAIDFCTEQGFDYEIRGEGIEGKPFVYCLLNENLECEVWDFYGGRCPTCEQWCEAQPHIMCEGYWKISGTYPECNCEFVCYTEAQGPVV